MIIFRHRVACRLTGRKPQRVVDGRWRYPPLEESMEEEGLQEVETYLSLLHNIGAHFIVTRPIMDLCLTT